MLLTTSKLFFLTGAFFRLVTCNKARGSGSVQYLTSPLLHSSGLQDLSMLDSLTSSSKGRSGPTSCSDLIGFTAEAFAGTIEFNWSNSLGVKIR